MISTRSHDADPRALAPTCIGIGVQKAATSWLHVVLRDHPELFASEPKELDFFSRYYDRGYTWYESFFASSAGLPARLEFSPSYFYDPAVPERIHAYAPAVRLVAVLRDPVSRAFSNHLHALRKGYIPSDMSFEQALVRNPAYILQSRYATHMRRWIDVFGREAILVLIQEEIRENPGEALAAACRHMGIAETFDSAAAGDSVHESVTAHWQAGQRVLRAAGDGMRRLGLETSVRRIKAFPPLHAALKLNRRDLRHETPPMSEQTRARLTETLHEETVALAQMLGRSALPWPTWRAR